MRSSDNIISHYILTNDFRSPALFYCSQHLSLLSMKANKYEGMVINRGSSHNRSVRVAEVHGPGAPASLTNNDNK